MTMNREIDYKASTRSGSNPGADSETDMQLVNFDGKERPMPCLSSQDGGIPILNPSSSSATDRHFSSCPQLLPSSLCFSSTIEPHRECDILGRGPCSKLGTSSDTTASIRTSYSWQDAVSLPLEVGGGVEKFSSATQALDQLLQQQEEEQYGKTSRTHRGSSSKRTRDTSRSRSSRMSFGFSDSIEIEDCLADELFAKLCTTDIHQDSNNNMFGESSKKRKRCIPLRRVERCSEMMSRNQSSSSI